VDESLTDRIAAQFRDCSLPKAMWTHHAHLRVGLWHLRHFPADVALVRLREGIVRYNVACGVANTENSGYHETVTRFYVWLIGAFLCKADRALSLDELAEKLIAEHGHKDVPLQYYSRQRLMSSAARLDWVEPDLAPLELTYYLAPSPTRQAP
jgi:hypothetical protein